MRTPALIEHEGVIHFSFLTDEGFHLVCPVSVTDRKVRHIGTPKPPLPPDGYFLLAWGKRVEQTLRAAGQWMPVLQFMSAQILAVKKHEPRRGTHKRREIEHELAHVGSGEW